MWTLSYEKHLANPRTDAVDPDWGKMDKTHLHALHNDYKQLESIFGNLLTYQTGANWLKVYHIMVSAQRN